MVKHGKDPRSFGAVDPTANPSWKKQYCFVEFCGTVTFEPKEKQVGSYVKVGLGVQWRQNKKDKASGEWKSTYHFLDAEAWNDMGKAMLDLRKGDCVVLKGTLRTDSWEDKQTGKKRFKNFLDVTEFELIERKGDPNLDNARADAEWEKSKPKPLSTDSGEVPDDIPF